MIILNKQHTLHLSNMALQRQMTKKEINKKYVMLGKGARGSFVYPVCHTCSNLTEKSDEIILQ